MPHRWGRVHVEVRGRDLRRTRRPHAPRSAGTSPRLGGLGDRDVDPRGWVGPVGRAVRARLLTGADRPGQHDLHAGEHAEGRERRRRTVAAAVDGSFSVLVDRTVLVGSPAEAELVKLPENTFRHVNIALVNELAMFARELGVDAWRAIDAAATKPFGYMKFPPRARCGRTLPADRPELPGVAGEAAPRAHVPVRRAAERRQRTHARLRAHPADGDAQRAEARAERQPDPVARSRLQEGDERLAREPERARRRGDGRIVRWGCRASSCRSFAPSGGHRRSGEQLRSVSEHVDAVAGDVSEHTTGFGGAHLELRLLEYARVVARPS